MIKVTIFLAILSIAVLVYGIVQTIETRKTFEINDNTGLIIDNLNGPVKITGWDKDFVDANTSNGSIQIYNVVSIANAKTSNGSIKAQIAELSNDVDIKSSNGPITLYLANNIDAEIEASTSSGKIKLHDFPIVVNDISKTKISGSIGDDGYLLKLKTSNSNINIYNDTDILF